MGLTTSRPSCCYRPCFYSDYGCRRFFRSLYRRVVYCFQWKMESLKRERKHMEGTPRALGVRFSPRGNTSGRLPLAGITKGAKRSVEACSSPQWLVRVGCPQVPMPWGER